MDIDLDSRFVANWPTEARCIRTCIAALRQIVDSSDPEVDVSGIAKKALDTTEGLLFARTPPVLDELPEKWA